MVLLGKEHGAVVEQVRIRVVAVDKENFGNILSARPTLDMDDDVERIGNVCLDGLKGNSTPLCRNATSETGEALLRGT